MADVNLARATVAPLHSPKPRRLSVSVRVHRADAQTFLFRFACDSCCRPHILATTLPTGWTAEPLRGGGRRVACAASRWDELVDEIGWEAA